MCALLRARCLPKRPSATSCVPRRPDLTAERASASLRSQCRGATRDAATRPQAVPPRPASVARTGRWAPWRWRASGASGCPGRARGEPGAARRRRVPVSGDALLFASAGCGARRGPHQVFRREQMLGTHDAPAAVESSMMSAFGWQLHLPEQFDASGLELVGSRRCLYGEGRVAHLMYRRSGTGPSRSSCCPKRVRPEELVEVLGHEAAIWSSGDRTFVLITRGLAGRSPADGVVCEGGVTMSSMRIRWVIAAIERPGACAAHARRAAPVAVSRQRRRW